MHDHNTSDSSRIAERPSELDATTLPSWAQDRLSRTAIDFTRRILMQPGGRERLDAVTAARKARAEAAKAAK